ncbi:helix-turn-helix transcriptional regulator [Spirillospora sp. CA-294931]|uniref:helix-turn-helix transcriptional regulator n=1 Tax=Spirillospora sp. CA-294931 TaxID=3240042 RepID=UPI003D8D1C9F
MAQQPGPEPAQLPEPLLRALKWLLDARADPEASVHDMADAAGLSLKWLQMLCRRHLGRTPQDLLRAARLHAAREALEMGAGSVRQIAAQHGYANPGRFAKVYNGEFGELPSRTLSRATAKVQIQADELLARVMADPSLVWAYSAAGPGPGTAPVDEVLYLEDGDDTCSVLWVRHPGSFTGTTGSWLVGKGSHSTKLVRRWADKVMHLADLVEDSGTDSCTIQARLLRWSAAHGQAVLWRNEMFDAIFDQYPDGTPHELHDLGDLTADRIAQVAGRDRPDIGAPGWDSSGWAYDRPRSHPILARLRSHEDGQRWRAQGDEGVLSEVTAEIGGQSLAAHETAQPVLTPDTAHPSAET